MPGRILAVATLVLSCIAVLPIIRESHAMRARRAALRLHVDGLLGRIMSILRRDPPIGLPDALEEVGRVLPEIQILSSSERDWIIQVIAHLRNAEGRRDNLRFAWKMMNQARIAVSKKAKTFEYRELPIPSSLALTTDSLGEPD